MRKYYYDINIYITYSNYNVYSLFRDNIFRIEMNFLGLDKCSIIPLLMNMD